MQNPSLPNIFLPNRQMQQGFINLVGGNMGFMPTQLPMLPRQMIGIAAQPFSGLKKNMEFKPRLSQASFGNQGFSIDDANHAWMSGVFSNQLPNTFDSQRPRPSFDFLGQMPHEKKD